MLECTACHIYKSDEEFPRNRRAANRRGRMHTCKACVHDYYIANKDRHRKQTRANSIKRRYGITIEEYDAFIAKGCGICGEKASTKIVLDHCHATDKVREALCNNCNVMLGSARDEVAILRGGADYLERHATA